MLTTASETAITANLSTFLQTCKPTNYSHLHVIHGLIHYTFFQESDGSRVTTPGKLTTKAQSLSELTKSHSSLRVAITAVHAVSTPCLAANASHLPRALLSRSKAVTAQPLVASMMQSRPEPAPTSKARGRAPARAASDATSSSTSLPKGGREASQHDKRT